jgi:hypothetical protein
MLVVAYAAATLSFKYIILATFNQKEFQKSSKLRVRRVLECEVARPYEPL